MKKIFIISSIFAILFSVFSSIFIPLIANAQSQPSKSIKTNTLNFSGGSCSDDTDLSLKWPEIFNNPSSDYYYKKTWNYTANSDGARSEYDAIADTFRTNVDSQSSGWGVAQTRTAHGSNTVTIFVFDPTSSVAVHKSDDYHFLTDFKRLKILTFFFNPNASCRYQADNKYDSTSSPTTLPFDPALSQFPSYDFKYLFIATDLTYPPDYNGEKVPPMFLPRDFLYPKIGYTVNEQYKLTAHYIGDANICIPNSNSINLDFKTNCYRPSLNWHLTDPTDKNKLFEVTQNLYAPFDYTLPGKDDYYLYASFTLPKPPLANISDNITLGTVRIKIKANGTFIIGSTEINDCSTSNNIYDCGQADPYEDCSLKNTIIAIPNFPEFTIPSVETIVCLSNNFGIWLKASLIDLFVPSVHFWSTLSDSFKSGITDKLGFLLYPTEFVVKLGQSIVNPLTAVRCNYNFGTFYGSPFSFDICTFEKQFPVHFKTIQLSLIALATFFIVRSGYDQYRRIV